MRIDLAGLVLGSHQVLGPVLEASGSRKPPAQPGPGGWVLGVQEGDELCDRVGAAGLTRALAGGLARHDVAANNVATAGTLTPATSAGFANEAIANMILRRRGAPIRGAQQDRGDGHLPRVERVELDHRQTYPVNGGLTFNL